MEVISSTFTTNITSATVIFYMLVIWLLTAILCPHLALSLCHFLQLLLHLFSLYFPLLSPCHLMGTTIKHPRVFQFYFLHQTHLPQPCAASYFCVSQVTRWKKCICSIGCMPDDVHLSRQTTTHTTANTQPQSPIYHDKQVTHCCLWVFGALCNFSFRACDHWTWNLLLNQSHKTTSNTPYFLYSPPHS